MINKYFFNFSKAFILSNFIPSQKAREDRAISAQARDVITNLGRFWHHQAPAVTCFLSPIGAILATSQNTKTVLISIPRFVASFLKMSMHSILIILTG